MKIFLSIIFIISMTIDLYAQDAFPPGVVTIQDEATALTKRRKLNFTGAGVSCADNSGSGRTDCTISGGGSGNSFETISVPAGTNPVADSSTDTLTITETSPLVITGTAGTDTIDITWSGTDIDSAGAVIADAVALTTDTTGNYVASVATTSPITGGAVGSEGATLTVACATCGVTGSPLSQFATTTSLQLLGVLSDETGSGSVVFGTAPAIAGATLTGVIDAGGTTDFEVENGANPTVDTAGEVSVDTSATSGSMFRFYGDASYQVPGYFSKSFVITGVTASGDFGTVWRSPWALTIRAIHVLAIGGTNVVGQLDECDVDGANCATVDSSDITATAGTNANDDGTLSNSSIDANDWIGWHTTSVSGTNTRVAITFEFSVDAVN